MGWGTYSEVRFIGGPADETTLLVHDDIDRIKVSPTSNHPPISRYEGRPYPRMAAHPPVYIYRRDVNSRNMAIYSHAEHSDDI